MKKTLVMVLALALVFGIALTACTSTPAATTSPSAAATEAASVAPSAEATPSAPATKDTLTENRPVLKFLVGGRTYDPNEDIPCKKMMELTGYQVKYEMLPTSNGDEKLMLEMSSGNEYDLVELSGTMFGRLADIGVMGDGRTLGRRKSAHHRYRFLDMRIIVTVDERQAKYPYV